MSKANGPPVYGPPPSAPPSYAQAVGGVAPASPFTPGHSYGFAVPTYTNTSASAQPFSGYHDILQAQQLYVSPGPAIVTTVVPVGPHPTHMICPSCHAEVDTSTRTEPGPIAYISGVLIALFGCWLGCCLIPCCIDECMDVHHNCPNCKAYLGRFRR